MKEDENVLEEKAKEFYKLRMDVDPSNKGFNPIEIDDFSLPKKVPLINYLILKGYFIEGSSESEERIPSPKSLRYKRTPKGDEWASL